MDEVFKNLTRPFNGMWEEMESDVAVLENILHRCPAKNLLTFKSVSKHWQSVLSSKHFIFLHQIRSKRNPKYFSFYDASGDLEDGIVREMHQMEINGSYTESYVIPDFETIYTPLLISSFNGLICCANDVSTSLSLYEVEIRICNPATRQVLLLPQGQPSVFKPVYGVAYSTRCHFYKIFKFFSDMSNMEEGYSLCQVYSSRTGEWKRLGMALSRPLSNPSNPLVTNHVCVNEKVYWFIANNEESDIPTMILMADMDEIFWEIKVPLYAGSSFLIELLGRLCLIGYNGYNVYIWHYYEENDKRELVDVPIFPVRLVEISRFDSVSAIGDEILFVYKDASGLRHEVLYNLTFMTWKEFRIAENSKDKAIVVFPFFETLFPCSSSASEEDRGL